MRRVARKTTGTESPTEPGEDAASTLVEIMARLMGVVDRLATRGLPPPLRRGDSDALGGADVSVMGGSGICCGDAVVGESTDSVGVDRRGGTITVMVSRLPTDIASVDNGCASSRLDSVCLRDREACASAAHAQRRPTAGSMGSVGVLMLPLLVTFVRPSSSKSPASGDRGDGERLRGDAAALPTGVGSADKSLLLVAIR